LFGPTETLLRFVAPLNPHLKWSKVIQFEFSAPVNTPEGLLITALIALVGLVLIWKWLAHKRRASWYTGRYTEEFDCKADAELQLLSLQERQLFTRYNPSNPGEHFMDPYLDIFKDEQFPPQRVLKH